ncbi:MAG: hypothetical protein GC190_15395 [Alphaproteobacteria bacterium]|nr:hypothetical protein [Alphaproteobacteria bacterium]
MRIAPYVAALAIGLAVAGTPASAADHQSRHRHESTTQQQRQSDTKATNRRRVDTRDHRTTNRNVRRHRQGADYSRWQRNVRAHRHFRVGPYHPPRGYKYRRWTHGQYLPWVYYDRSYWLLDFLTFGLMIPPPGCVWIRFGPDALLVDLESGEIIQVVYNVFY